MRLLIIFVIFTFSLSTFSREERTLARNPRALLMGDAFTALADDQYSLFYNPALLARHKGFSFYPLNISISGTNVLSSDVDPDSLVASEPEELADELLGIPIHVGANWNPGFKMGRFAISAINNLNSNIVVQNKISPTLEIDHRLDKGFVAGYAHPLSGNFSTGGVGEQLSMGVSIKYVQREGIYDSHYLFGTTVLDALNTDELNDILDRIGQVKGQGWGVDVGFDYVKASGSSQLSMGLAFLDIGTNIVTDDNVENRKVQSQPTQINFGTAWTSKLSSGFDFTLSADIKRIEQTDIEFFQRLHLGAELGLTSALSVLVGLNAVDNYSYGLKLNSGLIKIYAGFFGTETGEKLGQADSERFTVYLSLFHFDFNP